MQAQFSNAKVSAINCRNNNYMNDIDIIKIVRKLLGNTDSIKQVQQYISQIYDIRHNLIDLVLKKRITENNFYMLTSLLTPQSRSPLWESYFIKKSGAEKVSTQKNAGDFILHEKNYEYKVSGFNKNRSLHVVQIRLWQNCDYIIQYIESHKQYTFQLTHEQMEKELRLCKASSAHGTSASNKQNKNIEMRFSITIDSDGWKRWIHNYSI